jgi:uncharacterized protein (DUF58 family)
MSPEPGGSAFARSLVGTRDQAERLAQRLPGLLVEAERVASTVAQGVHGRRRTGVGETFWQFRPYGPGDDAHAIDWRQSARSRHLFIREQEWEAAESVWLWCDLSPSMRFRSGRRVPTKLERALLLTLGLAALLVRGGERVALLGTGERPRGGRQGLDHLARQITDSEALADPLPPPARLPRHARLVLISDFLEPLETLRARFHAFVAAGGRGCLLQIIDPAEEELPYRGRMLFEGMEREGQALIGNVASIRQRYCTRFNAHCEELGRLAMRQDWRLATHRTDRSAESGLLVLYQLLAPHAVR